MQLAEKENPQTSPNDPATTKRFFSGADQFNDTCLGPRVAVKIPATKGSLRETFRSLDDARV